MKQYLILSLVLLMSQTIEAKDWIHSKNAEWDPIGINWASVESKLLAAATLRAKALNLSLREYDKYKFRSKPVILASEKIILLHAYCGEYGINNGTHITGGDTCFIYGIYHPNDGQVRSVIFNYSH